MLQKILNSLSLILAQIMVNNVITKDNVERMINDILDKAVENSKKTPGEWDDIICQKLHDVMQNIMSGGNVPQ